MASTTSTIDFGARTQLIVTLFNENRFEDCKREIATILGYQELPRYYRIKCHIILAECEDDWYAAERQFQIAENMWWNARIMWPVGSANESTNCLLNKLRGMLDSLRASLEEMRPLEHMDNEEESEENAAESAEDNEEMFAGAAGSEIIEEEKGQDKEDSKGKAE